VGRGNERRKQIYTIETLER